MFHDSLMELPDCGRFNQALVSARCLLEIFVGAIDIDAPDNFARAKDPAPALLLASIKSKPIIADFANRIDPEVVPEKKYLSEVD
jgi:hypothetical protein